MAAASSTTNHKANILVSTAIAGGKDKLRDPPIDHGGCHFVAFTDPIQQDTKIWQQNPLLSYSTIDKYTHRRDAKPYKILAPVMVGSTIDYIVWHDAQLSVSTTHPYFMSTKHPYEGSEEVDADYYMFKHPDRNCIYQEMDRVSNGGIENRDLIEKQREFYRSEGMPDNYGLYELASFMMAVNLKTINLALMWFEQLCKFSSRDQCSFMYCVWKMNQRGENIKIHTLPGRCFGGPGVKANEFFIQYSDHLK